MSHKILCLITDPTLLQLVAQALENMPFTFLELPTEGIDIVAYLAQKSPSLTIVQLGDAAKNNAPSWQKWVISAKTSPATRKQPILGVSIERNTNVSALIRQAQNLGCDVAIEQDTFAKEGSNIIRKLIQAQNTSQQTELLNQARQPLPELARKGIEMFNVGEYYEQHELLEHAWRAEIGPVRALYQGILQVGVAYYQIKRKNYAGAYKMFLRANQYLNALPDECQGVNVAQLRRDAEAAFTRLKELGTERIEKFEAAFFKPVILEDVDESSIS
jgi:hypothetical protein